MKVLQVAFCAFALVFFGVAEEALALTRTVNCKYQVNYVYSTNYDKSGTSSKRWADIPGTSFSKQGQGSGAGKRRKAKDNAWSICMNDHSKKPSSRQVKNAVTSKLPSNAFYKIVGVRKIGRHSDDTIGTQGQSIGGIALNRWYKKGEVKCVANGKKSSKSSLCCSGKRAKSVSLDFCIERTKTCGWVNTPGLTKFTLKDYKGNKYYCSPKNKKMVKME